MEINQDKLLNEMKKRIAISNYNIELENENTNPNIFPNQIKDWRKYIMSKKKALNIASVFIIALILVGLSTGIYAKVQWEIGFKEYQNRNYELGLGTIKDAEESGYIENIEMDYIYQDNIGAKIDSLLITDEYVEATVNFKFPENMEVNTETFSYGFAVYDNEKNIYGVHKRFNFEKFKDNDRYTPYMYKEIGVKYDKNNIYDIQLCEAQGCACISAKEHTILSKITMHSSKGFPKSNKLYIRVNDLGFNMVEHTTDPKIGNYYENFDVSNKEWIFEIDVPEKFYERITTELTLKDNIENLSIEKIAVSEVGLIVRGTLNGFDSMLQNEIPAYNRKVRKETIYITDENGNVYYENTAGLVGNKDWFRMNFEITKNMLNQKFFLNVKIGEKVQTSELIIK